MRKEMAICFSDLHLNEWKNYSKDNSRLKNGADVIRLLGKKASQLGIPLLFSGDLIHNHKNVSNEVIQIFERYYNKFIDSSSVHIFGIDGNHDQSKKNTYQRRSPGYVKSFSLNKQFFKCVNFSFEVYGNLIIAGIPYLTRNEGFNEAQKDLEKSLSKGLYKKLKKILLIHTDLPGAKMPDGLELEEYNNINKDLDEQFAFWDIVLSGHIHMPQKLTKKVFMIGAPQQQTLGDAGCDMGYWMLYDNLEMEFIPLRQYPQFMYYDEEDTPPDLINFWIPRPVEKHEDDVVDLFNASMSRKSLAKKYCKKIGEKKKSRINYLIKTLNSVE